MKEHQIHSLPGYSGKIPSPMYGGYLDFDNDKKHIYYMFIEAEQHASTAPLMFWTNGGPGCSGLMGLFEEMGAFRPVSSRKLEYNPWTWTKFANIVFLEQPIGVGFSWSSVKKHYTSNDKQSAKDNLQCILTFLKLYPRFNKHRLYLISESYGGHYVPMWANEIIKYNKTKPSSKQLNFKGFMIGNPYINFETGWEAQMESYWGHQKIPKHLWDKFKKKRCNTTKKKWKQNSCQTLVYQMEDTVKKINPYAMDYPLCLTNQQNYLISIHRKKRKTIKKIYRPCEDTYTQKYLNNRAVQTAIHAKHIRNRWKPCSDIEKYRFKDTYDDKVPLLNRILNEPSLKDLHIFIMSGTNDSICGTVGTQKWIERLDMTPNEVWKQYFIDNEPAGYISKYHAKHAGRNNHKHKFIFATVNFAGHEVPMYKPETAFVLVREFSSGRL